MSLPSGLVQSSARTAPRDAPAARLERCLVCGEALFCRPFPERHPWLARCLSCGLGFADPQPDEEQLDEIYNANYFAAFGFTDEDRESYRRLKRCWSAQLLAAAERHVPVGRLLDVGSGLGDLLVEGRRRGWSVRGLERNPFAVAQAETSLPGVTCCGGIEESPSFPGADAGFDVITCIEVFEHLRRPLTALRQFREWLRPGGILVLTTIHAASLAARILGWRWFHYHRDHLWYFRPLHLCRLARAAGLEIVECRTPLKWFHLEYVCEIMSARSCRTIRVRQPCGRRPRSCGAGFRAAAGGHCFLSLRDCS